MEYPTSCDKRPCKRHIEEQHREKGSQVRQSRVMLPHTRNTRSPGNWKLHGKTVPRAGGGPWPCRHLDFGLLASKTVKD